MTDLDNELMQQTELPWLIFTLNGQHFAISSGHVTSIFQLENKGTEMPGSSDIARGVINMRGDIIPLIDLRKVMQMQTLKEEHEQFVQMLEARKNDHIRWVKELTRCVESKEAFTLTTNPHMCAFGKWYDTFETDRPNVQMHMRKLDEPHQELHHIAEAICACGDIADEQERNQKVCELLHRETDVLMPKILSLLDETKDILDTSAREMCVVASFEDKNVGLLVDEVSAVTEITFIEQGDTNLFGQKLVEGFASCTEVSGQILVVNMQALAEQI